MSNIVLLELEEDIRLAAKIIARRYGLDLKVYANYNDYKTNIEKSDIVLSSDIIEYKIYNFYHIKKPYTASELIELINKVRL